MFREALKWGLVLALGACDASSQVCEEQGGTLDGRGLCQCPAGKNLVDDSCQSEGGPGRDGAVAGAADGDAAVGKKEDASGSDPELAAPDPQQPSLPGTPQSSTPETGPAVVPDAGSPDAGQSFVCNPQGAWQLTFVTKSGDCKNNLSTFRINFEGKLVDSAVGCQATSSYTDDNCEVTFESYCALKADNVLERQNGTMRLVSPTSVQGTLQITHTNLTMVVCKSQLEITGVPL